MNQVRSLVLVCAASWLCAGCAARSPMAASGLALSDDSLLREEFATAARAPAAESLFKEDQVVLSNEELQKILAARVVLPDKSKLAVVRFGRLPYWWGWSEDFVRVN